MLDSKYTEAGGERTVSITAIRPGSEVLPAPPDKGISPRRWTREEYYRAAELGLFRPEERLELLDGEIIRKMTQKPPHAVAVGQAADVLTQAFGVIVYSEQDTLVPSAVPHVSVRVSDLLPSASRTSVTTKVRRPQPSHRAR
jgi:hypothetical protein